MMGTTIEDRIARPGPKRLLALDGGGIRGLISVEVLDAIETTLREQLGAGPEFVLADWFDYIAGTSTGAILAACLAMGMKVADLRRFYVEQGRTMFGPARIMHRLQYRFESEPLAQALRQTFGAARTLGSPDLRTLLMVTVRNASTGSPWPLSSNPHALYNDPALPGCNLHLPLWQVVRASTAAPTFFPPEVVEVGPHRYVFEDGGVTPYNNPAFLLFLMATSKPYRLEWPTGPDKLLLVSVGTGTVPSSHPTLLPRRMNLLYSIADVPKALIFSGLNQQDLSCRMLGRTLAAPPLDGEVGALLESQGGSGLPPLFTYLRYNAQLTDAGLASLGVTGMRAEDVQRMDNVRHVDSLATLGRAVAAAQVKAEHFQPVLR